MSGRFPARLIRSVLSGVLLAAVLLAAILRHPAATTQPLQPARTVILLLAPGASLTDWRDGAHAPTLASLVEQCPHGVFPTRTDETPETFEEPLASAARMIATGDRMPPHLPPTLADILKRAGIQAVTLADKDSAARTVLGLQKPDPLMVDQPNWLIPEAGFPDGLATDPALFARSISDALKSAPSADPETDAPSGPSHDAAKPQRLIVATFDDLYRADQYAPLAMESATRAQRLEAVVRLDHVIDQLTSAQSPSRLDGPVSLILLSPTASTEALARGERLGPILIWTPGTPSSQASMAMLLTSPSTRSTPGLLAGTDLAATVAATFGVSASRQHIGSGRAARRVADDGHLLSRIRDWDSQARAQKLLIYVPWILAAILAASAWAAARHQLRIASTTGAAAAFYPAALLLASGIVSADTAPIVPYLVAAIPCVLIAGAAGLDGLRDESARRLSGLVGLATSLVLTADILAGSHLLSRSPLSYSPMEAARFYGVGNEAAGALIGASLLTLVLFAEDLLGGTVATLLFGTSVCLTIALPQLGAKAGSLIGAMVGFVGFVLARREGEGNRRLNFAAVAAAGVCLFGLIAVYAILDAMRGAESRTHVGEAVAAAHQHGIGALRSVAERKLSMDLHLMLTSPWGALLLVEAVICLYLWKRRHYCRSHTWKSHDRALMVPFFGAGATLLLFNDAGVVGAAVCLLFAMPLALHHIAISRAENKFTAPLE